MVDITPMSLDNIPVTDESEENINQSYKRLARWMIVFSLSLLFIPLTLIHRTLTTQIIVIKEDLATIEGAISDPETAPGADDLNSQLMALRERHINLANITNTLERENVHWAGIMSAIGSYDTGYMNLLSVEQQLNGLHLTGIARTESDVIVYERSLEGTPWFSAVHIQAIEHQPPPTLTAEQIELGTPIEDFYPIAFQMRLVFAEGG